MRGIGLAAALGAFLVVGCGKGGGIVNGGGGTGGGGGGGGNRGDGGDGGGGGGGTWIAGTGGTLATLRIERVTILDGSANTCAPATIEAYVIDGSPFGLTWMVLSGPAPATITAISHTSATFTATVAGTYQLRLMASDWADWMDRLDFSVEVLEGACGDGGATDVGSGTDGADAATDQGADGGEGGA